MKRSDFDEMVQDRLFNDAASWPMAVSELEDFDKALLTAGLVETVPGDGDDRRKTPLGDAVNLDLLMAFLGIWDESEVPRVLKDIFKQNRSAALDEWRQMAA